ncbi:hypothetical protein GCM10029992_32620 [Glycomyces albus]
MSTQRQPNQDHRPPRLGRRRVGARAAFLAALTFLMTALIASVAPTSAHALPSAAETASAGITFQPRDEVGINAATETYEVYYNGYYRGWVRITVFDGGRKRLTVCDGRADPMGPGLQIDPSGPQAPITYFDTNGSNAGCLVHDIFYSVRKWRIVMQQDEGETVIVAGSWRVDPLPRPDF